MKKSVPAAMSAFVLMISVLVSCGGNSSHGTYEKIYERYNHLESFYAETEITVRNERNENTYYARQFYKSPNRFSFVVDAPEEVAGSGYVFRDRRVILKSGFEKNETVEISAPDERNTVFLPDFLSEYYKSEDASVQTEKGLSDSTTVMECYLKSRNKNRFSQKLFIDNKTYLPVKLETYDIDGNVRVTVKYNEFKRNCEIDESNFE